MQQGEDEVLLDFGKVVQCAKLLHSHSERLL
jgi:hypothetical protein